MNLFLFFTLDHMPDCRDRMMKKHSRPGKTHDFPNPLPHLGLITMHFAVRAKRLCLHERALLATQLRVGIQLSTLRTELLPAAVLLSAIQRDHLGNHLLLALPFQADFRCICRFAFLHRQILSLTHALLMQHISLLFFLSHSHSSDFRTKDS